MEGKDKRLKERLGISIGGLLPGLPASFFTVYNMAALLALSLSLLPFVL